MTADSAEDGGVETVLGIPALARGSVTEIFGESGAGKTQIAFALAASGKFPLVFWLDTEGTFRAERLAQMAGASGGAEALGRVRVRQVRDADALQAAVALVRDSLAALPWRGRVETLVVVDSVTAALVQVETKKKPEILHALARSLKALGCFVLVTNQVRADLLADSRRNFPGNFKAALGATWAAAVNVRLQVERRGERRRLRLVQRPGRAQPPTEAADFAVTRQGVAVVSAVEEEL